MMDVFATLCSPRGSATAPHNAGTPEACGLGALDEADVATASPWQAGEPHRVCDWAAKSFVASLVGTTTAGSVATIFGALTGQSPTLLGNSAFHEIPRSQEEKLLLQATLKREKSNIESGANSNEVMDGCDIRTDCME